jgi:hypothetical protein
LEKGGILMKFDFNDNEKMVTVTNSKGEFVLTVEETVDFLKRLGVYNKAIRNLYNYDSLKVYLKALTSKRGTGKRVIVDGIMFRSVRQACLYMGLDYEEACNYIAFLRFTTSLIPNSKDLTYGESLKAYYRYLTWEHYRTEWAFEAFKDRFCKGGGNWNKNLSFYKDDVELLGLE